MIDQENKLIRQLRVLSKEELRNMLDETKKIDDSEADQIVMWIKEEIKARGFYNKLFKRIKEIATYIHVRIKYFRVFEFLNQYKYNGGVSDE